MFQALVPLFAQMGVRGVPGLMKVVDSFGRTRKPVRKGSKPAMMAYVLISVPTKSAHEVMSALKGFPEVMEACTVYGESDVIARVEVSTQQELDDLIMGRIHGMTGIESTRTYLVVSNMYWNREEEPVKEKAPVANRATRTKS